MKFWDKTKYCKMSIFSTHSILEPLAQTFSCAKLRCVLKFKDTFCSIFKKIEIVDHMVSLRKKVFIAQCAKICLRPIFSFYS